LSNPERFGTLWERGARGDFSINDDALLMKSLVRIKSETQ
jgi:hypothetical protein